MGRCRKSGCTAEMVPGFAYCKDHKNGPNLVLPSVPVSIAVRQAAVPAAAAAPALRPLPGQATAAPPQHRRRGAVDFGSAAPKTSGQASNLDRMRFAHATQLAKRKTEPELLAPLIAAFQTVAQHPGFAGCLDDEVGWTNWSAWADWALRAIAPEIAMRPVAVEVRDQLQGMALVAGQRSQPFAERYFLELSLYCDAAIERMDTSFVLGQASQIFGPILAPFLAIPAAAAHAAGGVAAGYAAQAGMALGKQLVQTGIKAGAKELVAPVAPQKAVRKYENLNPMRFTLAWLAFVTANKEPRREIEAIVQEFGGDRAVRNLYAWLKASNL